jgi:hypothetical protein
MPSAVSLTRTYNARLAALLDKVRPIMENNISTSNAFYFKYKKAGNWKSETTLGDKYRCPLMYGFAPVTLFGPNGVGQVDVTPVDGATAAFFDWARLASSITIGDFEKAQNAGAPVKLLTTKTEQAMAGLEDYFGRGLLQGAGADDGSSITTIRNQGGNSFVIPIPLMITKDPTTSTSIGEINQSTETYWRNQTTQSVATTFAGLLTEIEVLALNCAKGAGQSPDLYVSDLKGYAVVSAGLRALQRYVDYEEANFPFKAIRIEGAPLVADQFVPDAATPTTTVAAGSFSTLYAVNSKFAGMAVYSGANFTPGDFVRAPNGAGETSLVQWYGAHWVSRRDKHGVLWAIKNNITS